MRDVRGVLRGAGAQEQAAARAGADGRPVLLAQPRRALRARARLSFVLERTDEVTATVVDRDGDTVRVLASDRRMKAAVKQRLVWDGRLANGRMAPDGTYRVRLNLRRQGRAVQLPRNIVKDTTPPEVVVTSIGPSKDTVPRPELLPNLAGKPARDPLPGAVLPARVLGPPLRSAHRGARLPHRRDARADDPRQAAAARQRRQGLDLERDRRRAPRRGRHVPRRHPRARPRRATSARRRRSRRGPATARRCPDAAGSPCATSARTPSSTPVVAGEQGAVGVGSLDKQLHLDGCAASAIARSAPTAAARARGSCTSRRPAGKSGLYVFEVRTRTRKVAAPVVVQSQEKRPVLVVLPVTTWQGLNPVDDDGDGRPDTLGAGLPVRIGRPYVKSGLPAQLPKQEALLLAQLDRERHRYDLTTDVALARGEGPKLAGHRGVILAGDTRWLDGRVASALRGFVRSGGNLLSVGTQSLRRTVRADAARPRDRSDAADGARPLRRAPARRSSDRGPRSRSSTSSTTSSCSPAPRASSAGIDGLRADARRPRRHAARSPPRRRRRTAREQVIVASRLGSGLVIRPGLPDFSASLKTQRRAGRPAGARVDAAGDAHDRRRSPRSAS